MRVAKWGNSLAVRLPRELVESMGLKSGDELEITPESPGNVRVRKLDPGAEFLEAASRFAFELPDDYVFDREDANAR